MHFKTVIVSSRIISSCDRFLADETVVLVVGVILGVPLEPCIKVHVEEGSATRLVINEVSEGHGGTSQPLETLVPDEIILTK